MTTHIKCALQLLKLEKLYACAINQTFKRVAVVFFNIQRRRLAANSAPTLIKFALVKRKRKKEEEKKETLENFKEEFNYSEACKQKSHWRIENKIRIKIKIK